VACSFKKEQRQGICRAVPHFNFETLPRVKEPGVKAVFRKLYHHPAGSLGTTMILMVYTNFSFNLAKNLKIIIGVL